MKILTHGKYLQRLLQASSFDVQKLVRIIRELTKVGVNKRKKEFKC